MGFNYVGPSTITAHTHSNLASDGGQLNIVDTRITEFSPLSLVVALG